MEVGNTISLHHANAIDSLYFQCSSVRASSWCVSGCETGNQIFDDSFVSLQSGDPAKRARAIVQAVSPEPSTAIHSYH